MSHFLGCEKELASLAVLKLHAKQRNILFILWYFCVVNVPLRYNLCTSFYFIFCECISREKGERNWLLYSCYSPYNIVAEIQRCGTCVWGKITHITQLLVLKLIAFSLVWFCFVFPSFSSKNCCLEGRQQTTHYIPVIMLAETALCYYISLP